MLRKAAIAALLLSLAVPATARKKLKGGLTQLPPKTEELQAVGFTAPAQPCLNWAWAAAIEQLLRRQNVATFPQQYWIRKTPGAYMGDLCLDAPPDLPTLKTMIDGEYVLDDGTHVQFEAKITSGVPSDPRDLIAAVRDGRTLIVIVGGRAMLLQSVSYGEAVFTNGQHAFELHQLKLIDPLANGKVVEITDDKEKPPDIAGTLDIRVGPVEHFK